MSWFLTFLVHSTLWCCLAWLWTRMRPNMNARFRETIWYTAIAASFITPTVQKFAPPDSAIWQLSLPKILVSAQEAGHRERERTNVSLSQSEWLREEHANGEHHQSPMKDGAITLETPHTAEAHANWQGSAHWA